MKKRSRILGAVAVVLVMALAAGAVALSRSAPCPDAPAPSAGGATMRAVVLACYGPPSALEVAVVDKPALADERMLVKVHAAALNPLDWHYMRGEPYIMRMESGLGRPVVNRLGVDYAGTVEAVGNQITRFKPGDRVFGGRTGAFAEYVSVSETGAVASMPASVSFEQAAAMPIAAITALQALRDKGQLRQGQKVLINGASGGVGTFAVQLASHFGADVTGVCSTRNVELVRSIGADHVVDYTREDFTRSEARYDLIIDNVGNHSLRAVRRVLAPEGIYVIVGGPSEGKWLGPMTTPLKAYALAPFISQKVGFILAQLNATDLALLADLMQTGKVTPVIDRRYTLDEVPEAIEYLETGRARGKVIIDMQVDTAPP